MASAATCFAAKLLPFDFSPDTFRICFITTSEECHIVITTEIFEMKLRVSRLEEYKTV